MKQYSQMKDSRIKGLGKIPSSWTEIPLQYLASSESNAFTDGPFGSNLKSSEYVDSGVLLIQLNNIGDGKFYLKNPTYITEEKFQSLSKHNAIPGDVVVSKMADPIARACLVPDIESKYFIVSDCIRLRTKDNVNNQFLTYAINSPYFRQRAASFGGGSTRQRIQLTQLKKLSIILPEKEQKQIINYLDKKTKKIDDEILKNQKLIELLKEQKQSVINHAVTKGLDDTITMKDSGIDWVGKIPKHWNVKSIRYILIPGKLGIKIGPFGSSLKLNSMSKSGFKVYGQENVIKRDFDLGERFIDKKKFDEMIVHEIVPNDIIVTMMGTTGLSQVVPKKIQKGIMDSHLVRIRSNNQICDTNFLSLLINSSDYVKFELKLESKGSIMEGLNSSILKSVKILLPESIKEQKQITDHLDKKTKAVDSLILKIELQIKQLQEFRESLISSAVTGKIQVTEA
ncbi:restriction endonuclease subunit S [Nitrosopumilus sp.]|uniref:restriction endonuclease subunit S n=1 Tax=Nitrosopumilus sp. TaxID=2024843 RepID=UPI00247B55BD|nr:restriction endonuclease subunit S [Nitrosopumilus sp.]MCV0430713.1 restriction endonuclease subunit S [Nitrosopumilus sp.]